MSKNEKPSSRFRRFSLPVALGTVLIVLAATFNAASAMPPLQADGEALFTSKGCNACHTIGGGDLVGPDLAGVTELRTQEWLTNWLIAPARSGPTRSCLPTRIRKATNLPALPRQSSKNIPSFPSDRKSVV